MNNSFQPPFLNPGDTIAIAATARKVNKSEIEFAIGFFEKNGFKVKVDAEIFSEYHQFAGTDFHRANHLQQLINNEEVKAILIARGGYGTARILDLIDFSKLQSSPKWIIGFSDATALLMHLSEIFNLQTIHGPMALTLSRDNESAINLIKLLFGKLFEYTFKSSHPLNNKGEANGKLIGGNLSVLYSVLPNMDKVFNEPFILFLEDLDEYLYHIDRMILSLKRSGKLINLKGLICGSFSEMKDNPIPFGKSSEEIIFEHFNKLNIPMIFNFPAGHGLLNMPVIFSKHTTICIKEDEFSLKFLP